jgi:LysR family transcriptional regulator, low CO2-responsive transcriptional regulator
MPAIDSLHAHAPFDSRQLHLLCLVESERSLSAAGRKLNLTQSAVSHALKKLEEDAGAKLVERNERGAELTQAGQALLRRAESIFEQMRLARDELHRLRHWGSQRLRFGASSTVCQYLLPTALSTFSKEHPKCRIEVTAGDTSARLLALSEGRLDLAIITHAEQDFAGVDLRELFVEQLCLVLPAHVKPKSPLLPYIGYQHGSSLSRDALQWFDRSEHPRPIAAMELESVEAIRSMVKLGLGYAVLPSWVVREDVKAGTLRLQKSRAAVTRTWSLAMRRGHKPTLVEETWMRSCADAAKGLSA